MKAGGNVADPMCTPEMVRHIASKYRDDPEGYFRDILNSPGDKWQIDVANSVRDYKRTAVSSGHGIGKFQHVDEPVLTPDGWRRIGDIQPGDLVAAVDGSFTRVAAVYPQGVKASYRVELDDGSFTLAGDEHLWLTSTRSERKRGKPGKVRTTAEISSTLKFANGGREGLNHCLPALSAVAHPKRNLPIEPYLLGFWLGDGDSAGNITGSRKKLELLGKFAKLGVPRTDIRSQDSHTVNVSGLAAILREVGLANCRAWEKYVPTQYRFGSIEQRTALLQGLLDSDGTIGTGAITFDTSSHRLAHDIAELVRSLGGVARRGGRQGRLNGVDKRWSYRVYVSLPSDVAPFRLPAKAERHAPSDGHPNRERTLRRFVKSVTQVEDAESVCIAIEHPSALYVTRDHIVTHNTREGAMIVHWFMATRPNPAVVCTANTESQLEKKLWRELKKVNDNAKNKGWFDWKAKSFTMFDDATSQAVALAWSEGNSEAFAGTHETHVLGVFDEASAISRVIFNVFSGAMTTAGARWLLLGNPSRAEGYFYDACHGKLKARRPGDLSEGKWNSFVIPSWESKFVDPAWVEEMREQHGEDSDEFRFRVAGLPPKFDQEQFIPQFLVEAAQARRIPMFDRWPLILGIDVGKTDRSVILPRRGRVILPKIRSITGERTTDFARRIAEEIIFYRDDEGLKANCIIEEIGMGVGVVETLQDMGYDDNVWGVNTGQPARSPELYANMRCEMWALYKEWLEGMVEIPGDVELHEDTCSVKKKPGGSANKLQLESKHQMRARGLRSPDKADAAALTFAVEFDLLPEKRSDIWRDDRRMTAVGGSWMGN